MRYAQTIAGDDFLGEIWGQGEAQKAYTALLEEGPSVVGVGHGRGGLWWFTMMQGQVTSAFIFYSYPFYSS